MAFSRKTELRRSLSLPLVLLYGLGNILGAGIYVLIGKVAGEAGSLAPYAFLIASFIAAITAFTYAELSSRYPLSAGEAVYVQKGLGIKQLSQLVGLLIIGTGIVSAATIAKGFVGYLQVFINTSDILVIIILMMSLGVLAIWGITQSVTAAAIFTLIEIAGLVLVIYVSLPVSTFFAADQVSAIASVTAPTSAVEGIAWSGVVGGAFLAFYAYVGFEDMVNVAEEVKQPRRNMPIAILGSLAIASVLYVLVAFSALGVLSPLELSQADAPLAAVYQTVTGSSPWLISVISLFAVTNGALIQIIMASRVCYGLASQGWLPSVLGRIHPKTKTPVIATILVTFIIVVAALFLPIETLANATTYFLLTVFSLINLSLLRIKQHEPSRDEYFVVPFFVPVTGFLVSVMFLVVQTATLFIY